MSASGVGVERMLSRQAGEVTYCEYCEALGDCPLLQTHWKTRESYRVSTMSCAMERVDHLLLSSYWLLLQQWCWGAEDTAEGKKLAGLYTICLRRVSDDLDSTSVPREQYLLCLCRQSSDRWIGKQQA